MSVTILALAKLFVAERLSGKEFTNSFIELWKFERDNALLQIDKDDVSECLSSVFCLADLYNPNPDRDDYELDEDQLRVEIKELITKFRLE